MLLQIHGSLSSSNIGDYRNRTAFAFTIDQTVIITESFYPKFKLPKFLSDTGGAVGLWLGLGMVQLIQYFVTGAQMFRGTEK